MATRGEFTALLASHLLLHVVFSPDGAGALKMERLGVPQYKVRGEMAVLECPYELEDDTLYSVKWYKDNEEFYRYVPKSDPRQFSFRLEGIKVEHQMSDEKKVALRNVNLKSSGIYRCEVSAEAPSFASVQKEALMQVVFLPKDGPHITGEEKQYQIGDEISLNCTSGKSYPASVLHWYINEQQVRDPAALVPYPHVIHPHGLYSSVLGLRFALSGSHFRGGSMRVRCVASVSPILWRGDRESVVQRAEVLADNVREALLLVKGSGWRHGASLFTVALLTSLVLTTTTATTT